MTRVINLFAGPGAGKSTIAAELFAEMKWLGHSVELINEHAKVVTWEKHHNLLQDQVYISAMQNRKQVPLVGQVDWIITDSPLLISLAYVEDQYMASFRQLIVEMWNTYDNVSYFVNRKKNYVEAGRSQTLDQARLIDNKINGILEEFQIERMYIPGVQRIAVNFIMRDLGLI